MKGIALACAASVVSLASQVALQLGCPVPRDHQPWTWLLRCLVAESHGQHLQFFNPARLGQLAESVDLPQWASVPARPRTVSDPG